MKNAFGILFLWLPVFFGIGIIGFDLFHPNWKILAGILAGTFLILLISFFTKPLLKLAKKFQLFHPARLVRFIGAHIFKLLFYILILPIILPLFSQAFLFMAGLVIFRKLLKILRWLLSPDILTFIKPFFKRIINLIPWKFIFKWSRRVWRMTLQKTWAGDALSLGTSKLFDTLKQPLFWIKKTSKKGFQKLRRFQIKLLRWSLRYLQNPRTSFLKKFLFLRQRKIKFNFSFRPDFTPRFFLIFATCFFAISIGIFRMGWRTTALDTTIFSYPSYQKDITGIIQKNEVMGTSQRLRIQPLSIGNWTKDLPQTIRVSLKVRQNNLRLGDTIKFNGTVYPTGKPIAPNAFDFSRYAYYEGIGGVGYINQKKDLTVLESSNLDVGFFQDIRQTIKHHILKTLPTESGLFILTILLGERYSLPKESLDIFRKSGLSHLMSVSGFHLAALGLIFFILVRFLAVLIFPISRRLDVKKFAAGATLIFLTFFLFISDARLPTQRAYIMTALAMVAILINRSPFSLRLLALSALMILGISPESIFNPGFQMSFACAGALIFVYNRYPITSGLPSWRHPLLRILKFLYLTFLTSIIAFIATAPFVIYHFHTLSTIGIFANILAIPFFSFILLPLTLMFTVFPLSFIGNILEKTYLTFKFGALKFAEIDVSYFTFSQFPTLFIVAVTFGGLVFILWPFRYRKTLSFSLIILAFISILFYQRPHVFINSTAEVVAFRNSKTGKLIFATNPFKDKYSSQQLMQLNGESSPPEKTKICYRKHPCIFSAGKKRIMIIRRFTDVLKNLVPNCHKVDYVVVPFKIDFPKNSPCKGKIIDLNKTEKGYAVLY
ncbi:MAG: ComEC/Rec2 family competence protein [Alphaproteobacteria bacterium]